MAGLSLLDEQRLKLPSASDEQRVRAIAGALIDDLGLTRPPVDVAMVASMLDIKRVLVDPHLAEAACLMPTPTGFEIRLRASDSSERRRFSTGHECGHTFHAGYELAPQFRCTPTPRTTLTKATVERLCDVAASELLLPATMFRPDARSATFGRTGVEALSDAYNSSLAATGIALVNHWPEPAAFLVMERIRKVRDVPGAPPKLRLKWHAASGTWPFFCRLKSASTGDPFERAEEGEIVNEITSLTGVVDQPVTVELHAWRADYTGDSGPRTRVLALARRVQR